MNTLSIGLMGLNFFSGNLGCCALAYSFRSVLEEVAEQEGMHIDLTIYTGARHLEWERSQCGLVTESVVWFSPRKPVSLCSFVQSVSDQDVIFDFTEGDSFADLYGMKRFCSTVLSKRIAERHCTRFILGPQTYGPFSSSVSRALASGCIRKASAIFSRDDESARLIEELTGRKATVTTDVAFALPYEKRLTHPRAVGVNVSGLLWNGGYTGNNQFGLRVDYREYCRQLAGVLLDRGHEVHVIGHVFGDGSSPDEDYAACKDLCSEEPRCILAPRFRTPMAAKSYISSLGAFTGARMHATIAAFSSGVPTVPFAYSKKFAGLYGSLGYDFIVDARELDTPEAVLRTVRFLTESQRESECMASALAAAYGQLSTFKSSIRDILLDTVMARKDSR